MMEHYSSIKGGCISAAYRLVGNEKSYFVKQNHAQQLDMFIAEAEGLDEIAAAKAIRVPQPICYGTHDNMAYLVMEYLPTRGGGSQAMETLGRQLATMHRQTQDQFGWHRDNTIGSTPQVNTRGDDWPTFWGEHRLGFQLKLASGKGAGSNLLRKGEKLLQNMHALFSNYRPQASLLHGDLWSGNYGISQNGEPVIFDPAVYYGDREADLAMTELFGGFPSSFYAAYKETWQLDPGYKVRKTFYNLYHILNHFNLFGADYASQAEHMLDELLSEIG